MVIVIYLFYRRVSEITVVTLTAIFSFYNLQADPLRDCFNVSEDNDDFIFH